jgi:hypothetical protein
MKRRESEIRKAARTGAVGRLAAAAFVSVVPGSLAFIAGAFAQAGSVGGTIGKTDKSVSGSDQAPSARPESKSRKLGAAPGNVATSLCGKLPGNWSWFNYPTVVINPDGTASAPPFSAMWTCKSNSVVMHWNHGFTDRLTLSRDGTHLEGTNGSGTVVSGDRR